MKVKSNSPLPPIRELTAITDMRATLTEVSIPYLAYSDGLSKVATYFGYAIKFYVFKWTAEFVFNLDV